MSKKIIFECEVVTPMFLAGADGKTPELRAPSIKGAIRFWWRALNGHLGIKLREKEAKIFGGSGDKEGRSKVLIRVVDKKLQMGKPGKELNKYFVKTGSYRNGREIKINILDYLAFGAVQYDRNYRKNLITRGYIDVGSKFNILVQCDEMYESEVKKAFYYFFKYGNLGSKARNGFGSINLLNSDVLREIEQNLVSMSDCLDTLPDYTAFSKHSVLFETADRYDTWHSALAEMGKIYRDVRLSLEKSHCFDRRQYVALPLTAKGEKNITQKMKESRKAKSYFLKVIKEGNKYKGLILCLPSKTEDGGSESLKVYNDMNNKLRENKKLKLKEIMI